MSNQPSSLRGNSVLIWVGIAAVLSIGTSVSVWSVARAQARGAPVNAQTAADPNHLDALLLKMQEADTIEDDVKRCLAYPDMPDMAWDHAIVEARCALQRKPRYGIDKIAKKIETQQGRDQLERAFDDLLKAHYEIPAERDQIFLAFDIFDDSPQAKDTSKRWHSLNPSSAYSRLAYGKSLASVAQTLRGQRSASDTPASDMRSAQTVADQAAAMLASAYEANPRLSPACAARAKISRMGAGKESPFEIGRRCAQADPRSYMTVLEWKGTAEPRWGGDENLLGEVERHVQKYQADNPLLNSVLASLRADRLLNTGPDPDPTVISALEHASRYGPNSLLLNQLSASRFAHGDQKRGLAYLSEAIRFNIGPSSYRGFRAEANLFIRPKWAILDTEYLLRHDPTSVYYKQRLAQAQQNLRNGTANTMAQNGKVAIHDGGLWRKATLLSECEAYGLSGKRSSEVMNNCSDRLVGEWPEDPEAWRVRADVLHARGDARALQAAEKYLVYAPKSAPDYEKRAARYRAWLKGKAD
jgi:hypothetical protein